MQVTYKFRLRDKHCAELKRQARAVSFVRNFCNETQRRAARIGATRFSGYDLEKITAGTSKDLDLHAHTIAKTCSQATNILRAGQRTLAGGAHAA